MKLTVFTDGASRGNPGLAGFGFVITGENGQVIKKGYGFLGETTNNVAEYTAVLEAFKFIKDNFKDQHQIEVFADSRLIIEQLSGRFKIKSLHLRELFLQIKSLEENLSQVTYTHVRREQNKTADKLANLGIDRR
ncbi:MAG: ribonuclease HI family protein [Candidatus Daviesbacteria bacterium]|nr:MAG: ribonuclease HI family protein [Candidatus Daviesbacteria bacterium]